MADMMGDVSADPVERVGERLRAARLAAGLELGEIAQMTRIPLRLLDAIEQGSFETLPSFTYAAGFVRAYARAVGADEVTLGRDLREELGRHAQISQPVESDDVADPARVPPRWLVWTTLVILIVFAGGYAMWRSSLLEIEPDAPAPVAVRPAAPKPKPAPVAAAPLTGPVVLTARDDVWFRVYDRQNKVLFEGIKKKGESYTVPVDADTPMIRTGRADQIDVTLGGTVLPPLGPAERTVKDVVLTAAALTARPADGAAPSSGSGSGAGRPAVPAAPSPASSGAASGPALTTSGSPQP